MQISQLLATKRGGVTTISPKDPIRAAVALMAAQRIGALVVVDETGKLAGILSERDIVRWAAQDENLFSIPVEAVMTREVVVGTPEDDVMSVAHTMTERRFRHLPIVVEGRLFGIISIGDVLKAQRDAFRGEIDTLEVRILAGESGG
jgi:CBS domain-containing protein